MADIKAGQEILEIAKQLEMVIAKLQEANVKLGEIDDTICKNNSNYDGKAKDEINSFCLSQKTHLQKIMGFYNKAAGSSFNYFTEMKFTDEELTKIIISLG